MTDREAIKRIATQIEYLAFQMPPPNSYTPQFVMLAEALRAALAQPEKEWVGLTDEERHKCWSDIDHKTCISHTRAYGDAIEAKLKEKNS